MTRSPTRPDARRPQNRSGLPGAVPVGRIRGVPVFVHWSVVIITALIAWGLAGQALPAVDPDRPTWAYVVTGAVAAVVFMLGLLAHEASHAVVARRAGVEVESITLWLFGGVAQLRGEAQDPGTELRIAGVGPLVSFLLGAVFYGLAVALAAAGVPDVILAAITWLAIINVVLAVFNVLPGAPLDGGRLLRAALWKWRGDRTWAAITAARAGRGLGAVLIGLGLAQFLLTNTGSGLWLALIGWFILSAAGAEEQHARLDSVLAGVRVRDVMTARPDTVPADLTVAELIERHLFTQRHTSFPLVDDDGRPLGLVTLARIKQVPAERRAHTRLTDIAYRADEVPLAAPDDPISELLPRLTRIADGRALVVERGQLVGIVTPTDITRAVEHAALRRPAVPGSVRGEPPARG
jgi:Zn-dependent protease/CBS domain-containing protein